MVKTCWHQVTWPVRVDQDDLAAYTYGDAHFTHAWTVTHDHAYFVDVHEAVQFALLFGGGQPHGSDT